MSSLNKALLSGFTDVNGSNNHHATTHHFYYHHPSAKPYQSLTLPSTLSARQQEADIIAKTVAVDSLLGSNTTAPSAPSLDNTSAIRDAFSSASSGNSSNDGVPSSVHHSGVIADWGLTVVIFLLVPLFFSQLAQIIFPVVDPPHVDITPEEADRFARQAYVQMDRQYICVLSLGALGLLCAIGLAMTRSTSRSAILGLAYGSLATWVFAVYSNVSRLSAVGRVSIAGVLLVCCLFLPRMTQDVLLMDRKGFRDQSAKAKTV